MNRGRLNRKEPDDPLNGYQSNIARGPMCDGVREEKKTAFTFAKNKQSRKDLGADWMRLN